MLQRVDHDNSKPLASPGSAYTDDEIFQIGELLKQGLTARQIAERFRGRTRNAIIGVIGRNEYLNNIGLTRKKVVAGKPLRHRKRIYRNGYTTEEIDLIQRMCIKGMTYAEMNNRLPHRAPQSIRDLVRRTPKLRALRKSRQVNRERTAPRHSEPVVLEGSLDLPLVDLGTDQCRYATNNASGTEQHLFCGRKTKEGSSYCEGHDRIVHGYPIGDTE